MKSHYLTKSMIDQIGSELLAYNSKKNNKMKKISSIFNISKNDNYVNVVLSKNNIAENDSMILFTAQDLLQYYDYSGGTKSKFTKYFYNFISVNYPQYVKHSKIYTNVDMKLVQI